MLFSLQFIYSNKQDCKMDPGADSGMSTESSSNSGDDGDVSQAMMNEDVTTRGLCS